MVRKKRKRSIIWSLFKFFIFFSFFLLIFGIAAGIIVFSYFVKDLPNPEELSTRKIAESTKIYDRTGQILLYDIHGEEKRTIIPLSAVSPAFKNAIIAVEDEKFYQHPGLDLKALLRALIVDIVRKGKIQGGSTITQQLIKNSILSSEKTFTRKIKEIILSFELERKYNKDEILEMYLNQISFGSNAYGVEAAALTFFGKKSADLNLNEAALLAALPKAPSYYSPYGNHKEELLKRKNYILDKMFGLNFISKEELETAKKNQLEFLSPKTSIKAPHFVMYLRDYLNGKYGEEYIEKAGLKIYTTLDFELQKLAEKTIEKWGKINEKNYDAKNAALLALDPKTGQILAMVGSRDYFDLKNDGNVNVVVSLRQPGSAFKPFAYAAAFDKGYLPETILFDLKTEFNPNCPASADQEKDQYGLDCYHPDNYDGKFRGPVSFKEALAQSLNIPSVKVLYLAGIDETIKLAEKVGISTLKNRSRFGLSLVLGGAEVKLLEITSAYGAFANDGILNSPSAILKITDSKEKIIEEYQPQPKRVLVEQIARLINNILSDDSARAPMFGEKSLLYLEGRETAAKTGTTQDYKDAWTIGYAPNLAVGIWSGNNIPSPMKKGGAGLAVSGSIWHEFISEALKKYPSENFIKPEKIISLKPILNGKFEEENVVKLDKISGKLATNLTPLEFIEEKIYKEVHTILKYLDKNNPLSEKPINSETDPQFKNWEEPILMWAKEEKRKGEGRNYFEKSPSETDDVHTEENKPKIIIISPTNNEIIKSKILEIKANVIGNYPIKQVDFFLDDQLIGSDFYPPYFTSYLISNFDKENKNRLIKVRAFDIKGNKNEEIINFYFQSGL